MNKRQTQQLIQRLARCVASNTSDVFSTPMQEPATFFTDTRRWQQERDSFFFNTPQLIGFAGELKTAGSYITTQCMDIPILATRDEQGELHAFINACSPLDASATKDSDLTRLPISDRGGLLMVGLRSDMPQARVDHALDAIAEQFSGFGFEHMQSLQSHRFEVAANWKLVVSLSHESYHFASLHRDSLAPFMSSHHIHDEFGLHTRWAFGFRDIEALDGLPVDELPERLPGIMNHTIFPGTVVIVNPGDAQLIRVEPGVSPDTSVVYFSGVCESNAAENVAENKEKLAASKAAYEFGRRIFETEDLPAAEQCQQGINAGLEFITIGANEPVMQLWHRRWHEELKTNS